MGPCDINSIHARQTNVVLTMPNYTKELQEAHMQSHVLMVFDMPGVTFGISSDFIGFGQGGQIQLYADTQPRGLLCFGGQFTDTKDAMELCDAVDVCFFKPETIR